MPAGTEAALYSKGNLPSKKQQSHYNKSMDSSNKYSGFSYS
jgi:hypothetical protein